MGTSALTCSSFVVSLESEIRRLQKQIAARRGESHSLVEPSRAQQRETLDVESLVSDFGFLSVLSYYLLMGRVEIRLLIMDMTSRAVNATSRDIRGFSSGISFSSLVLIPSTLEGIPSTAARPLPVPLVTRAKIQQYLQHVFIMLPFFEETSFWGSVNALQNNQAGDWDSWVVFMVLAINAASQSRKKGDEQFQEALGFAATALTKADSVLHPGSIKGIQAILFLAQFALYLPDLFDVWYLIGTASRILVDLGLHQERRPYHCTRVELRKRVFHCVYTLDRYVPPI